MPWSKDIKNIYQKSKFPVYLLNLHFNPLIVSSVNKLSFVINVDDELQRVTHQKHLWQHLIVGVINNQNKLFILKEPVQYKKLRQIGYLIMNYGDLQGV